MIRSSSERILDTVSPSGVVRKNRSVLVRPRCIHCGSSLPRRAAFCHRCGHPMASEPVTTVAVGKRRRRRRDAMTHVTDRSDTPEQVVWHDTFSCKALINQFLIGIGLTIVVPSMALLWHADGVTWMWLSAAFVLGWGGLLAWLLYRRLDVDYILTNQRLIHRHGILTRLHRRIEVIDIDDVSYRQSLIESIVGVGTIEIISSDITDSIIELPGINRVSEVVHVIDEVRLRGTNPSRNSHRGRLASRVKIAFRRGLPSSFHSTANVAAGRWVILVTRLGETERRDYNSATVLRPPGDCREMTDVPQVMADGPLPAWILRALEDRVELRDWVDRPNSAYRQVQGVFTYGHPTVSAELMDRCRRCASSVIMAWVLIISMLPRRGSDVSRWETRRMCSMARSPTWPLPCCWRLLAECQKAFD